MAPVRWEDLAWPDVGSHLGARPNEIGLVPVGATEQHGPHLPTGTDTIIATALCNAASERTGAVVLPSIPVGCSYGHGAQLPGTLSVSPEELALVVRRSIEWASQSGLSRFVVVNGHFGNQSSLLCATDHLRHERPDLRTAVVGWWALDPEVLAKVTADGEDVHANRAETSVMLAIVPELVHVDRMATADDPDRTGALVFRYTATSLSANGVTGRPSEADADLGAWLVARSVDALVSLIERGRAEEPPLRDHHQAAAPVHVATVGAPR
jgi:creatinine amidohydrolase